MEILKRLILWNYSRETSVYVIFCLLIVAFIFLTPKSWFERREKQANPTVRLIVKASELPEDRVLFEKRVRELSGYPKAEILSTVERREPSGERLYEIEIR
jgi:hypothetical protein